ncbi:MAG: hypothetical protein KID09_25795, partial [Paenibacillus macerans]|nr:hypothetical protein [Paenibacillus macerans]
MNCRFAFGELFSGGFDKNRLHFCISSRELIPLKSVPWSLSPGFHAPESVPWSLSPGFHAPESVPW